MPGSRLLARQRATLSETGTYGVQLELTRTAKDNRQTTGGVTSMEVSGLGMKRRSKFIHCLLKIGPF
jgi:hypothetical protein